LEGTKLHIFTKNWTKLKQKLKYYDQIENEKMTSDIIVTRDTVIATWHDVSLTRDKIYFFLKKNSKKKERKKERNK